jgi:hypothetical protein
MTFQFTDPKGVKILGLMNDLQDEWQNEEGVDWISLYNPTLQIGTITATDTFSLDLSTIRKISQQDGDSVRVIWSGDTGTLQNPVSYTDYELVPGDRMKEFDIGPYCARQGSNLVFSKPFATTDAEFGGKLYVPAYLYVDTLVNPTDDIQVDNPRWLVLACAAEAARTDNTRVAQYPNLLAKANAFMQRMKDDNLDDQNTDVTMDWNPSPWTPSGNMFW